MSIHKRPVVQTKQGKVRGTIRQNVEGGEFLVFDGIPFAQPPIGDLRFQDPLPIEPWNGIYNANIEDPKPAQYNAVTQEFTGTEDCLYLNVATNSLNGKQPVMVWVAGGGFNWGSYSTKLFGPDYFLKKDIVFVIIGYRLGCFGFLNLDLAQAAGNQGIKDLVMGLNWVQENIEAFGGDPENVTVFGESAGGAAVHLLTISPLTKGLFHKAIIQSAVALNPWTFSKNPMKSGLLLAATLCCRPIKDPAEALEILKQATTDQLLKAGRQMRSRHLDFDGVIDFVPSVDSATYPQPFIPEPPNEMAKRGINVPLIIGSTSDEGVFNALNPNIDNTYQDMNINFAAFVARSWSISDVKRIEKIIKIVRKFYFGDTELLTTEKNTAQFIRLMGDMHFYIGIQQVVDIQSKLSTPTYVYQFSYAPSYPTICTVMNNHFPGSCHGAEIGALFYTSGEKPLQKGTKDYLVMQRLIQMWTNFAKTGNPTPKVDELITTKWEPITKTKMNYLNISEELVMRVNFGEAAWKFWKPILQKL